MQGVPLAAGEFKRRFGAAQKREAVLQRPDAVCGKALVVNSVPVQGLVDETRSGAGENQTKRAVPVGTSAERFVEAACADEHCSANCRPGAEATLEDRLALSVNRERTFFLEPSNDLGIDFEKGISAQDVEVGSRQRELAKRLEALRQKGIVRVQHREELAGRDCQRGISRGSDTTRDGAAEVPQSVRVRSQGFADRVRRTIVGDDQLCRGNRLCEHRLDSFAYGAGRIASGDDDGERRGFTTLVGGRARRSSKGPASDCGHDCQLRGEDSRCTRNRSAVQSHPRSVLLQDEAPGGTSNVSRMPRHRAVPRARFLDNKRVRRFRRPAFLGTLRRTAPLSDHWGRDRGTPVDRYYIDGFLADFREAIRGRVLEVLNADYTQRFGHAIERSDVLDVDEKNPQATIIADLAQADEIPSEDFDCFILTQTLQYIYDIRGAASHAHRVLRPGGTLLCTVPAVSRIARRELESEYWRLTAAACSRLFGEVFEGGAVDVRSRGNVLTAVAFLMGMASEELSPSELELDDPFFPVVVTVRAKKAI